MNVGAGQGAADETPETAFLPWQVHCAVAPRAEWIKYSIRAGDPNRRKLDLAGAEALAVRRPCI